MKTLVIYDSVFGNTQKLAEAMAGMPDTQAVKVADLKLEALAGIGLLIMGSPTRGFKPTPALVEWLKNLPDNALNGVMAAAFDSRISEDKDKSKALRFMMKKFGYAGSDIEKGLKKKGAAVISPAEGFFVDESEGPLSEGEEARAVAWAQALREKVQV